MRLVFAPCEAPETVDVAAFSALPDVDRVTCLPRPIIPLGPAVYVAYADEHLHGYERWFPGLAVRARAILQHHPLQPGSAAYLPVTFESWCVVADGPAAFGAVLEAARLLKGVKTVVCPAIGPGDAAAAIDSTARRFRRWRDRVVQHPADTS